MCNKSCIDFGNRVLTEDDVSGSVILEVGSYNVNGSLREKIEEKCRIYIGVDIEAGPGVDIICNAEDIINRLGKEKFDIVICTEVLEHIKNWQLVIHNLKEVLIPGGVIVLTTRSKGFPQHGYPGDYWRFEEEDMSEIFTDFDIEVLEKDPSEPGVFIKAGKPMDFIEKKLTYYKLYSVGSNE